MRRFVVGLCCFIVGLQVLIGVPAAVTVGLLCLWAGGGFGPAPTIPPPGDFSVSLPSSAQDAPELNAILESRQRNGSPLAETSLSNGVEPGQDNRDFAAAFQFVAAEAQTNQFQVPLSATTPDAVPSGESITANAVVISPIGPPVTAHAAAPDLTGTIRYLYAAAERHESGGNYPRADELRTLARALRREIDQSGGASSLPPIASATPTPAASQSAETAPVPTLESGPSAPLEVDREAANPEPNQPRAN